MPRTKHSLPIGTVLENLPPELAGLDPKFTPSQVAAYLGIDEKWLAGAREGLKDIPGPGYIKLGNKKNSPVRYPLSEIRKFEERLKVRHSVHRTAPRPVSWSSFDSFMEGTSEEPWLFAVTQDGTQAVDIFSVLSETQEGPDSYRYRWLTRAEFLGQRFIRQELQLSAELLAQLQAAGNGDASKGLAALLQAQGPLS